MESETDAGTSKGNEGGIFGQIRTAKAIGKEVWRLRCYREARFIEVFMEASAVKRELDGNFVFWAVCAILVVMFSFKPEWLGTVMRYKPEPEPVSAIGSNYDLFYQACGCLIEMEPA